MVSLTPLWGDRFQRLWLKSFGGSMNFRIPVAVALAFALVGCTNPNGTGGKVPMQTKVTKVQAMTKTFSISKNTGLNKAAQSVKELATALQSAFGAGAGVIAPGGANLSGTSRRYAVEDGLVALRAAGMRATYQVSGVADYGDAKLIYDDQTGEVTAIEGKNAKITFAFVNNGNQRSWDAVIVKAPDGTTGKFHIEVTGGWRSMGALIPSVPVPAPMRPKAPTSGGDADFSISQADDDMGETTANEQEPMPEFEQEFTPMPTYAPPPYKWFNNEFPETVDVVKFSLEIVPKGDASLAFKMAGTFDQPENVPNSTMRVPTHWKYTAQIPKISFDWESNLDLVVGRSKFNATGALNVEGDAGKEQFTYELKADEQARNASFAMTNVNAKVQLLLSGSQKSASTAPVVKSELISTEDGSVIGTVALDPKRPRYAIITFTADKSTMDWELYPAGLLPEPVQTQPLPPSAIGANGMINDEM
jgi:hypothetical protein